MFIFIGGHRHINTSTRPHHDTWSVMGGGHASAGNRQACASTFWRAPSAEQNCCGSRRPARHSDRRGRRVASECRALANGRQPLAIRMDILASGCGRRVTGRRRPFRQTGPEGRMAPAKPCPRAGASGGRRSRLAFPALSHCRQPTLPGPAHPPPLRTRARRRKGKRRPGRRTV